MRVGVCLLRLGVWNCGRWCVGVRPCKVALKPLRFLHRPSFARELMTQQPTGLVIASEDKALACNVQAMLMSPVLRAYTSSVCLFFLYKFYARYFIALMGNFQGCSWS